MSASNGIFRNLVNSFFTKILVAVLNFLILLVSARYLGVNSRGEISIFLLNIAMIQILNEVFTGYSLIYFMPRFNLPKMLRFGIVFTVLFCTLSNLLIVLLRKQIPGYEWLGWLVSLLVILHTFNCVLILGREQVRLFNLLSLAQPMLLFAGLVLAVFVFRDLTFTAYLYPLAASFVLVLLVSVPSVLRLLRSAPARPEFRLRPIFINGIILQSVIFMYVFANRYTFYLLPDTARVGLYASAVSLMEAMLIVAASISPVLIARVSNLGDAEAGARVTLSLARVSLFFSATLVGLLALVPESFLVFFLGQGFAGIRALMMMYAPAVLMISLFMPLSAYFSALGRQRMVLPWYGLGFAATLGLAPWLVGSFDTVGAAYTANIAYFIMCTGIVTAFVRINKIPLKQFLLLKRDLRNLKQILFPANG